MTTERQVAEFHDPKLTGLGAVDRFAREAGRIATPFAADGTFRFTDGLKTYKPVMIPNGWKIVEVQE